MAIVAAGPARARLHARDASTAPPFTRADLEGTTTVLVFYPFAFSPVCTDQLSVYNEVLDDFAERGRDALRRLVRRGLVAAGVQGAARRRDRAALGLRAQGRHLPRVRRAAPGRLPAAGARARSAPTRVVRWSYEAASPGELPGANLIFDALGRRAALSDLTLRAAAARSAPRITSAGRTARRWSIVYGDYECPFCAALEVRLRDAAAARLLPPLPGPRRAIRARSPAACAAEAAARAGRVLADARRAVRRPGPARGPAPVGARRAARPRRRALRRRPPRRRRARRASRPTSAAACAPASPTTPTLFLDGERHAGRPTPRSGRGWTNLVA